MTRPIRLGVNVDHVATLRQQRDTQYPDPVTAAALAELAGAEQITVHLREDRRHIQDRDVEILRRTVGTVLNLEMAATSEMVAMAKRVRPHTVTLVPERREERTTEGGLDVVHARGTLARVVGDLRDAGIAVSLFIDPDERSVATAAELCAHIVELHTGDYCEASGTEQVVQLRRLRRAAEQSHAAGLLVAGGHGLDYVNVKAVAAIAPIEELNIGHSIVARAVLVGFDRAVREMLDAMAAGRRSGDHPE